MKSQYIGLAGYEVKEIDQKVDLVHIKALFDKRPTRCVRCGSSHLVSKGPYLRDVRHLKSYGTPSRLRISTRRWQCKDCRRTFVPMLPGILPGQRFSMPLRREIYQDHHDGICASRLARRMEIGHATVGRIYSQFTFLKAQERKYQSCPQVLGIDEHTLHKGRKFVTTFCNIKKHKVFEVLQGKSSSDLRSFLSSLKGRHKVKVICIDLSSSYRHLLKKWFPNAHIVADRFHVIRIVQYHFLKFCRQLVPEIKNKRGMLNALRKNPENLKELDKERLKALFKAYPAMKQLYKKQLKVRQLLNLKHQDKRSFRKHSKKYFQLDEELLDSGLQSMETLATTLKDWAEEIGRMWRFSKNNGVTEGFHRKMKLIQRCAYGFRNFENYRLRVIAHCG